MPKDFLQGASLTPTFEALMVKFGGKIGTLYQMLKNAFKKHPLQNRTNVQIKGGGGQKAFWTMFKKTALFWNDGFPYLKYFLNTYHVGGLWPSPWRHMLIIIYDIWSKGPYLHFFQFVTITTTYFLNTYHLSNFIILRIIISSYDDPHVIIRALSP